MRGKSEVSRASRFYCSIHKCYPQRENQLKPRMRDQEFIHMQGMAAEASTESEPAVRCMHFALTARHADRCYKIYVKLAQNYAQAMDSAYGVPQPTVVPEDMSGPACAELAGQRNIS